MSVNASDNWETQANSGKKGPTVNNEGLLSLASLVGMSSVVGGNRENTALNNAIEDLTEFKKQANLSSHQEAQRAILPEPMKMDINLSPTLPGMILYTKVNNSLLVGAFLFSNRESAQELEDISTHNAGPLAVGLPARVQIRQTPNRYINIEMLTNVTENMKARFAKEGVNEVHLVTSMVIDLENYPKLDNERAQRDLIRNTVLNEWEAGVRTCILKAYSKSGAPLAAPFINSKGEREPNAFGKHKHAVARTEPCVATLINGIPSGSNLAVRLQTSRKNEHYDYSSVNETSRELVTAYSSVSLVAQPFNVYATNIKTHNVNVLGLGMGGQKGYAMGYKPLQAVVVMNAVKAGPQMGNNNGVASWLMGVYASMSVNHNYLFTEALRSQKIGARGNLSHVERRVKDMLQTIPGGQPRDPKMEMTETRLKDVEFVNEWIRNNISERAAFAIDLVDFNVNAALNNFLINIAGDKVRGRENKETIIAVLDSMSGNEATRKLEENAKSGHGWNLDKPVLHPSPIMLPVGTMVVNGEKHSLEEVDEIFLSRMFPTETLGMLEYLRGIYGDGGSTPEDIRRYRISTALAAMLDGDVNITGYARRHYLDPEFCVFLGSVMETLGTMQASGIMGTMNANLAVFAPGIEYVLNAAAGASGYYSTGNVFVGNNSGIQYAG